MFFCELEKGTQYWATKQFHRIIKLRRLTKIQMHTYVRSFITLPLVDEDESMLCHNLWHHKVSFIYLQFGTWSSSILNLSSSLTLHVASRLKLAAALYFQLYLALQSRKLFDKPPPFSPPTPPQLEPGYIHIYSEPCSRHFPKKWTAVKLWKCR